MNRNYWVFLLAGTSVISTLLLQAELGCMEKSLRLLQRYDPKEYHYVEGGDGEYCNCPCSKYRAQAKPLPYGQCPVCKHFRSTPSLIIITKSVREAASKKESTPLSPVAYEGVKQLQAAWIKTIK